jgi:hypothetical protein
MRFESVTIAAGEKTRCKSRPRMKTRIASAALVPRGAGAALQCDDAMRRRCHQPRRPLLAQDQAGQSRTDDGGRERKRSGRRSPDAAPAPLITPAIWRGGVSAPHYTWGAFVFLRHLQRTFSHRGREQLGSLDPLLGLTHPLWPAKGMRARHRFHVIPPCRLDPDAVNDTHRSGPSRDARNRRPG